MGWINPLAEDYQRRRFTRPDGQRFIRHDAYRFAPPGSPEAKMPGWLDPSATRVRLKEAQEEEARARAAAEQEAFEREVLALRRELASLKLEYELWRFDQKYRADQPRVPAGSPEGGQWTSGGGDTSGASVSDAGFSPDRPGWHDFTAGPNLVCAAELRCSREEMANQLARFSVPGRDPSNPVQNRDSSVVYDPKTALPGGWVRTAVSDDGLTIVNRTSPAHIFYDGVVVRTATQRDDGAWYVTTRGFGNNVVPGMNILNQEEGPVIFGILDRRLRDNIERHHAKGISHLAMHRLDGGRHDARRALLAGPSHVR